jgi:hypothetical protein
MYKLKNRLLKVALVFVTTLLFASSVSPAQSSGKKLKGSESVDICPGIDESKVEKVDILILLDNSKSLSSMKGNSPSDKNRQRFDALENMFESISSGIKGADGSAARVEVDVSLMAFAQTTKFNFSNSDGVVPLTSSFAEPGKLADEIRNILKDETQANGTNFINALNDARQFLDKKSDTHCKFLIWFTDGVFDYDDAQLQDGKKEQDYLNQLVENTCSSDGWSQQLRESHVNTYVVLLGELATLRNKENFQESLDLMAQITGDRTTSELGIVNDCPSNDSTIVGEIFSVGTKEIGKLLPVFQQIGSIIGGGRPIYCPTPEFKTVSTPPLPNSKFIKSLSLISLDLNPLPQIEDIKILAKSGERLPVTAAFRVDDSVLDNKTQIDFYSTGLSEFEEKGWKIELSSNTPGGFCLMATFVDPPILKISKVGNGEAQVSEEGDLLSREEISEVMLFLKDGDSENEQKISPSDLMRRVDEINADFLSRLRGELNIEADPLNPVFGKNLGVTVLVDKPIPDLQSCLAPFVFQSDRTPTTGDTPKNRDYKTLECEINTLDQPEVNSVTIDIIGLISRLKSTSGCEVIEPSLLVNGENKGDSYVLPVNQTASLALNFKVGDTSTFCNLIELDGVAFIYGDPSQKVFAKFTAVYDLKQPPDSPRVILVSTLFVIAAMILSLLLLRFISSVLAVMPDRNRMYSYEVPIEIELSRFGQLRLSILGVEVSNVQPSAADLKRPLASSSKSSLVLQQIRLDRKLGGLFKPFTSTRAIVASEGPASYWQQSGNGGLAVPFRRAIIVSTVERRDTSAERLTARLSVLVPTSGVEGGIVGVNNLLKSQKLVEVCRDFFEKSNLAGSSLTSEVDIANNVNGNATNGLSSNPDKASGPKKY